MAFTLKVVAPHPVSYHVAFYRALNEDPRVVEEVVYLSDDGLKPTYEAGWGSVVDYGDNLLQGYNYRFLRNFAWNRESGFFRRLNPEVIALLFDRRSDAVLITGYDSVSAVTSLILAKLRGKTVLLRAEADLGNPASSSFKKFLKRRVLTPMIRSCDAVMYSCRRNREHWTHFGARDDKLYPILSSVDNAAMLAFREQREVHRATLRSRYGLSDEDVLAVFVGRIDGRKAPGDLLAAMAALPEGELAQCRLIIAGDGPDRQALQAQAKALKLEARVYFEGYVSRNSIPAMLAGADIFCLPSVYDPTPKALNEAMACGLACIASSGVGTSGDLLIDGESGLVVESGDVAGWASALRRLIVDPALRSELADGALRAVAEWSPQANVDGVVAAIEACNPARR